MYFLKAPFNTNTKINVSRVWLWRYQNFTMLYELTKNGFFHLSVGVVEILFIGLSEQYNSFL